MKNIHQNSREAHKKIKPELTKRQKAIYDLILRFDELTSKDVAIYFKTELHKISGRFGELKKKGKIEEVGKREGYAIFKGIPEAKVDNIGQLTINQ